MSGSIVLTPSSRPRALFARSVKAAKEVGDFVGSAIEGGDEHFPDEACARGDVEGFAELRILELVDSEIRYENLEGGAAVFPHTYGPLRASAVVGIGKVEVDDAGLMSFVR